MAKQKKNFPTEEEVRFVLDNCDKLSYAAMGRWINRSHTVVAGIVDAQRRKEAGIELRAFARWTDDELKYVAENYLLKTAYEIGCDLGRTRNSIVSKTLELKLSGNKARKKHEEHGNISRWGYKVKYSGGRSIFEHVSMVESELGRPLGPDERVHHINMVKLDNRIENFDIVTRSQHAKAHHSLIPLVSQLMEIGVIYYDRSEHIYKMAPEWIPNA